MRPPDRPISPPVATPSEAGRAARVLVVDGDAHLRRLVEATLAGPKLQVDTAGSAGEALERLERNLPDVVVLEPRLAGTEDFGLLRWLRSQSAANQVPVILLSSLTSVVDQAYGYALGAAAFVAKPFSPLALIHEVESALQTRAATAGPSAS